MKRTIKNLISVIYTFVKFCIIKIFHWNSFSFYFIERFSPGTEIDIGKNSKLILEEKVRAHTGVKIRVRDNAKVRIGKNTSFNYNCIITSHHEIVIGENVMCGPNVLIYDHDHDFRVQGGITANKFKYGKVEIGNNVWIGANTVILRNTKIGDNCVIGAGSVVSGEFPNNSLIVQKRKTDIIQIQTNQG